MQVQEREQEQERAPLCTSTALCRVEDERNAIPTMPHKTQRSTSTTHLNHASSGSSLSSSVYVRSTTSATLPTAVAPRPRSQSDVESKCDAQAYGPGALTLTNARCRLHLVARSKSPIIQRPRGSQAPLAAAQAQTRLPRCAAEATSYRQRHNVNYPRYIDGESSERPSSTRGWLRQFARESRGHLDYTDFLSQTEVSLIRCHTLELLTRLTQRPARPQMPKCRQQMCENHVRHYGILK
jgi:hypothetical protein